MTPEQLVQERAKYGIPPEGFGAVKSQANTDQRLAKFDAALEAKKPFSMGDALKNFSTGVAKGEVSTLKGIGSLGQTVLDQTAGRVSDAIQGKGFTPTGPDGTVSDVYRKGTEKETQTADFLEPKGTAQNVGKFTEQAAEFAVPISKVGTAVKGVELLNETSKATPVVKILVNSLPRAAAEGLTTAGVVSAQNGEVDMDSLAAGLISGVIPFGGATFNAIKQKAGPELSARLINSLIKPLKKDFSYGKNPGRAVASEGIVANNLDDLGTQINSKLELRLTQLENQLAISGASGAKADLTGVLKPIDDAILKAEQAPRTNAGLIQRLKDLKADLQGIKTDEVGNITEARNLGKNVEPGHAVDFKRIVGALTKFTGNASDDAAVNSALKAVYGQAKERIETAVPESKALNERIADLISAKVATNYRDVINQRQSIVPVADTVTGLLGALTTAVTTGGAAVPTIIAGLGAAGLRHALATPAAKTRMAAWLAKAAPAEKEALFKVAPWAKGIFNELVF